MGNVSQNTNKNKKTLIITIILVVSVIFIIVLNTIIIPTNRYKNAVELMNEQKYDEAVSIFEQLSDFKDSEKKIEECKNGLLEKQYVQATDLMKAKQYDEAITIFKSLDDYKDCKEKIKECEIGVLEEKYNHALTLIDSKKYIEAYEVLTELEKYKDSEEKRLSIIDEYELAKLKQAKAGEYITFGKYEQDNNTSNGKEKIEWLVLERKNNRILVISKYALDYQPYNTQLVNMTWEQCTLRQWLNYEFINKAFSSSEKDMIKTVELEADWNPEYAANPGNNTKDKIFILSMTEVKEYFSTDDDRECKPTDFIKNDGLSLNEEKGTCFWWLRTPGSIWYAASNVNPHGAINVWGDYVNGGRCAVRPAMWIEL